MKTTLLLSLFAICALAQESQHIMLDKVRAEAASPIQVQLANVTGAPYSATMVTESTQTLADGNRIVQKHQGAVARDSQGRMRNETPLPVIGNMSAKNVPSMVFINDPVSGLNYSLNLADKTYRKTPAPTGLEAKRMAEHAVTYTQASGAVSAISMRIPAPPPNAGFEVTSDKVALKTESLGSKVFDGVMAEGTRTTRTIPAGEIGNEKPIEIVSETWFSPDLKTIVYSRRSDPRTGELVYSLTNISRTEPDASLFAPPADYKVAEGSFMSAVGTFVYRPNE